MEQALLVITNLADMASAQTLARALVERRLAACVNVLPAVQSIYRWNGAVEEAAEVTLLIDREAAIPVLNSRNQLRNVAYGDPGSEVMELRFAAANADVQLNDLLTTSGLDGVYPPGLPVARVMHHMGELAAAL